MFCTQCGSKNSEESKFCASCGNKLISNSSVGNLDLNLPDTAIVKSSEIIEFAKQINSYLNGSLSSDVESKFCEIVKAKKFDKVLSNVFVSEDVILITPHSKDRNGIALTGLILTGGAGMAGILGMTAGSAIAQLFSNRQAQSIQNILKNLENTLVLNSKTIKVKAYDYRRIWDLAGGEWETRISIGGEGYFNGKVGDCTIIFSIEGKTYERTFFSKANNKVPELCKILGIAVPDIKKETKFIW
jgi:hypothetical protein